MSIEHPDKPPIYWTAGLYGEKHEIPENAIIHVWSKKKKAYLEVWIDDKTGSPNTRIKEGGLQ